VAASLRAGEYYGQVASATEAPTCLDSLPDGTRGTDQRAGPRGSLALALALLQEHRAGAPPAAIEAAALELLAALVGAPEPTESWRPRWLARVEERLREEYATPPPLGDLAADAGVHPVHLARVFHRHRGESVGTHVRRLKVQRALERLSDPATSLADIAFETGFADQSHFTRVFRRVTGHPPGVVRRLLLGSRSRGGGRGDRSLAAAAPA
jgi:AraC family transcriptional regulator